VRDAQNVRATGVSRLKLGRGLAQSLIKEARAAGYSRMRLYTLPTMREAVSLYHALGFHDISAYGEHIIENAFYMELNLV
jgi:ribosomal protein S18 acetylase RimI-like enzyme